MKMRKSTLQKMAVIAALCFVYAACMVFYYREILKQNQTHYSINDFFTRQLELAASSPTPQPALTLDDVAPIDINAADTELLQLLPGIGPAIAQNILEYRNLNGAFLSIEELLEVSGIGEARLEKMRPYISAGQ